MTDELKDGKEDETLGGVLRRAIGRADTRYQVLHECTSNVQMRKNPKGATAITFLTSSENLTATEVLNGNQRFVGIVVWVPREVYPK